MLQDVLGTLARVPELGRIVLVTREPEVQKLIPHGGFRILPEPANQGQTSAVVRALTEARRQGIQAVLALPGDIPLISPDDVGAILRAARDADVVLVPSRDREGTNALWLRLPAELPLRFGPQSFRFHQHAAEARGLRTFVLERPTVALDIDGPEDLQELVRHYGMAPELARHSQTAALLEEMSWLARFR